MHRHHWGTTMGNLYAKQLLHKLHSYGQRTCDGTAQVTEFLVLNEII